MSVQDDSFRTYALDGQDAIRDIEGSLLTLESEPENAAEINRLYRALHSLKGNSALLGLSNIETLSHAAEDMVGLARDHGVAVDGSMVDLMLRIVDCLRIVVERAGRQHLDAEASETAALVADVHGWIGARGGVRKVELGATRGEILIWSDIPAADVSSPTASRAEVICDEQDSSEFFVALVRELSPTLQGAVRAALGGQGVELDLLATCVSELSQPALRLGLFELVDCFGTLEHMVRERDGAGLRQQVATLADQLDTLERAANLSEFALAAPYHALLDGAASQQEPARAAGAAARPARDSARQRASRRPAEDKPRRSAEPEYLRIDAHKLSIVLDLAGEIALASGAVTHHPELAGLELEGFTAAAHKLEVLIRELQNEVSAMRLVPVSGVFQSMKRVVRDTARRTGKSVELSLVGEETEIDKVMVDSLHDPLVHLVRNAIDHGIESPTERMAAGKSPVGTVVLEASHQGGEVSVRVRDDGRGLQRERILARAVERGLVAERVQLSDAQVHDLVMLPGFSTKEAIDELSGRGVGMDVIKTTIEQLRGRVRLESQEGKGSTVDMTVPLTLAFVEAMVVRARDRLFALPIEKVFEVFKVEPHQLARNSADGETTLRVRDSVVPLLWLHRFYGEQDRESDRVEGKVVVVVQNSQGNVALPVDSLLGNQPVMLKPLRGVLANVRAAAGCGMLRSGEVALALDCERLRG